MITTPECVSARSVDHGGGEYPETDGLVVFLDRLWVGFHPLLEEGRELVTRNGQFDPRLRRRLICALTCNTMAMLG